MVRKHSYILSKRKLAAIAMSALGPTGLGGLSVATAQDSQAKEMLVAPQSLSDAINVIATQSGVQIVLYSDDAWGMISPRLEGLYTIEEALNAVLAESGLAYRRINDRTIAVAPRELLEESNNKEFAPVENSPEREIVPARVEDQPPAQPPRLPDALRREGIVYVTARKRDEAALAIPISVTAFSQDALIERGVDTPAELSDFVPGFKFENTGPGGFAGRSNPVVRFRGVGTQSGSASARAGALFWDGAYVPDGFGVVPLIDLQQVEVIKGPQTAFFGRNTFAGAVNFIPSPPTEAFEGRLTTSLSRTDEDSGYGLSGIFSGPVSDRLSARVALSTELKPADYKFRDGTAYGEEETHAALGSIHFELSDATKLKYSGFYVDSRDTTALASISADVQPGDCLGAYSGQIRNVATNELVTSFTTNLSRGNATHFCGSVPDWDSPNFNAIFYGGTPPATANIGAEISGVNLGTFENVQTGVASEFSGETSGAPDGIGNTYEVWRQHLSFESDLKSGHKLAGLASVGKSLNYAIFDQNFGSPNFGDLFYTGYVQRSEDKSLEVRMSSPQDGRVRYMLGASYFGQDSDLFSFAFAPPGLLLLERGEVFGIFGAAEIDLSAELTLSAEGRWQDDTQVERFNGVPGNSPSTTSAPEQNFKEFMPRIILAYQPSESDLNLYASWSKSILQGTATNASGFGTAVPNSGINLDDIGAFTPPQELNAYEVGVKQKIAHRFQYGLAAYHMEWQNQVYFALSPAPLFLNLNLAGSSEYTGLEVTFEANVSDWLRVSGGYNYVDAKLIEFIGAGGVASTVLAPGLVSPGLAVDSAGKRPRHIPALSGNLSAEFHLASLLGRDAYARLDLVHTGNFFIDNYEYDKVAAHTKLNLRASFQVNETFGIEIFGTNILGDRSWGTSGGAFQSGSSYVGFGAPTRGREIGVRLTSNF